MCLFRGGSIVPSFSCWVVSDAKMGGRGSNPVEDLPVVLVDEIFSPPSTFFGNQEVNTERLRDEIACDKLLLDVSRAVE